jgi:predicted DNA-binding protein YlxM (UPF0122 family)
MKNKKTLALTLGLGLAMGSLTMGTASIVQANQKPAETQNMQTDQEKPMYDKANHQEMLTLLKIDEQTFKQEKDNGKSLAEIAVAHNVSRQTVVNLVVKHMSKHIDKDVTEKRLTKEQATAMKTNVVDKAQKMVDGQLTGSDKMDNTQNPQDVNSAQDSQAVNITQNPQDVNNTQNPQDVNNAPNPQLQEMLTLLKIDEPTFAQEQNSGKSLAKIAATHQVSRQAVVDLVVKQMNQEIDTGLAEKRVTVDQAKEMKANVAEKAKEFVDKDMTQQPADSQPTNAQN